MQSELLTARIPVWPSERAEGKSCADVRRRRHAETSGHRDEALERGLSAIRGACLNTCSRRMRDTRRSLRCALHRTPVAAAECGSLRLADRKNMNAVAAIIFYDISAENMCARQRIKHFACTRSYCFSLFADTGRSLCAVCTAFGDGGKKSVPAVGPRRREHKIERKINSN